MAPWRGTLPALFPLSLVVLVAALAGCAKKPISKSELRAVTNEVVAAAQRVLGRQSGIEIQPEVRTLQTGLNAASYPADNIYFSLPDPSRADDLRQSLRQIARRHNLVVAESANAGVLRFEFSRNGVRTHSIHVIAPLAARPRPPVIARAHPQAGAAAPLLAIILDDMGHDRSSADQILALPFPLTLSILPNLPLSTEVAEEAHRRGDQVLLHCPMEPEANSAGGPDGITQEAVELRVGMTAGQVDATLAAMLSTVPHAAGVNNHEGSRATSDPALMNALMPALRSRNLFFIDSRTSAATVAFAAAQSAGVPAASRKVFLDDIPTTPAVLAQLDLAVRDASRDGSAIAIGHPHPATIAALAQQVPALESRGLRLVFASDLVR